MRYFNYTMTRQGSEMRAPLQLHAFRKLLVQETDETKRQMLFLSLAEEEARLKALMRAVSAQAGDSSAVHPVVKTPQLAMCYPSPCGVVPRACLRRSPPTR
jgi:hypothetical protein